MLHASTSTVYGSGFVWVVCGLVLADMGSDALNHPNLILVQEIA